MSNMMPGLKRLNPNERGENGIIDAIPKSKGEDLIEIIRNGITQIRANSTLNAGLRNHNTNSTATPGKHSAVEELHKLAELKEKGIISEEEFIKMKDRIIKSNG